MLADINNVGSMSQALYAHDYPVYDEVQASRWQAEQVSTISIFNFSGRIFIGTLHLSSVNHNLSNLIHQ